MKVDSTWHKEQIKKYQEEFPYYKTYAEVLHKILEAACKIYAPLAIVQSRPKTLSSFAEKAVRKAFKYTSPVTQLTDLCGARVITHTQEEAGEICRFIRNNFLIDEANSLDVRTRLKPSEFGYLSVHYVVQIKSNEILGIKIPPIIGGRKAEIQVRTLLQHAWAAVAHERIYKSQLRLPEYWHRHLARVAALLEESDSAFTQAAEGLDAYKLEYGAYLTRDQMREEMEILRTILKNEPVEAHKPALSLRLALLAKASWEWEVAARELEPYIDSGCCEKEEILLEHGHALCQLHKRRPRSPRYIQGQKELKRVAETEDNKIRSRALAYLGWSYRHVSGQEGKAKEFYRRAYEAYPANPYNLSSWLEYEIFCKKDLGLLPLMRQTLLSAIETCRGHAEVGIELPWAFFAIAKFRLLLAESYESLGAFALAVHLLIRENSPSAKDILDDELEFISHIRAAKSAPPEFEWAEVLLGAAKAVAENKDKRISQLKDWAIRNKKFPKPVIIVAGGTSKKIEAEKQYYHRLLIQAFDAFEGTMISGGTTRGIPGIVGAIAKEQQASGNSSMEVIAYLPKSMPADVSADRRYHELIVTEGNDFNPVQPLHYWADLLASGVRPHEVKVLAVNGGPITAFECRLALALGATVGIMGGGGEAPADLRQEADWWSKEKLLWLPHDSSALRAFVSPAKSSLRRELVERLGKAIHGEFLQDNRQKSADPVMMPWKELREDLRDSNRQQAAYAEDVLRKLGYGLRPTTKRKVARPSFKASEVEAMAEMEHGRWVVERLGNGWKYGSKRDALNKISPHLVSWNDLPDEVKEYDRKAVLGWPKIFAQAGLEIRRTQKKKTRALREM